MFAALNDQLKNLTLTKQIIITAIAILPAISAGLQKEWQLATREQTHMLRIQDYRSLLKQLAFIIAFPSDDLRQDIKVWLDSYEKVMDKSPFGQKL